MLGCKQRLVVFGLMLAAVPGLFFWMAGIMGFDTVAMLALVALTGIFVAWQHRRMEVFSFLKIFYFCMIRTGIGIRAIEAFAQRLRPALKLSGWAMIPVGFLGMALMLEELVRGAIMLLREKGAAAVGVVLPIQAKGVFYVPFLYWLVSIAFIMVVHEFGHGVIARAHRVRIKSTGLAFIGALIPVIPGAFVEIDEKHLAKKKNYAKLSIFASGPFINIICGIGFWLILLLVQPVSGAMLAGEGMRVLQVADGSPAVISGLAAGDLITGIDAKPVLSAQEFEQAFAAKKPGENVRIITSSGERNAALAGTTAAYLGVQVEESKVMLPEITRQYGRFLPAVFIWLTGLIYWLFVLNIGVGLFNLVPLGLIDGGRMLHTALEKIAPHRHVRNVWHAVSILMLAIIVGTVVSAFV